MGDGGDFGLVNIDGCACVQIKHECLYLHGALTQRRFVRAHVHQMILAGLQQVERTLLDYAHRRTLTTRSSATYKRLNLVLVGRTLHTLCYLLAGPSVVFRLLFSDMFWVLEKFAGEEFLKKKKAKGSGTLRLSGYSRLSQNLNLTALSHLCLYSVDSAYSI